MPPRSSAADALANPVWDALQTGHRRFAIGAGDACRYPADVAPFGAVASMSGQSMRDLRSLMLRGESVWLACGRMMPVDGLAIDGTLDCVRMALPPTATLHEPTFDVCPLSAAHAAEMVALTDIAFPGFFRPRTHEMGSYCGIRREGELVAMAGERLALDGYTEISGVCTHPAHRGKGFAQNLVRHLAIAHRRQGVVSWLHVGTANGLAIELYQRLGFEVARKATLHRVAVAGK
ncbi:MAG TPA: GNAT family N-acetyltransferase [Tepidisphaeraceae bacterium]